MEHAHQSLRYALTRTILVWATVFFLLLGSIFILTFEDIRNYTLQKVAEYRLNYQAMEFSRHLKQRDISSIAEESDALVQDPEIAGIVLIDSSGELLHTSIHDEHLTLKSFKRISPSSLVATVYNTPHLHLFESNIPESGVKLYLVLDDRPITRAIQTSTLVTGLLLLSLLALSIFALHRVLRIQLIEPLDQLRSIVGSGEAMPDKMIREMENVLPSEAGGILETYDQLVHAEHDMAKRFHDMLDHVPGCIWAASPSLDYIEASARSTQVFNCTPAQIRGCRLWSWLTDKKQMEKNLDQLREAVAAHAPSLETTYSIRMEGKEVWYGESISLHYRPNDAAQAPELAGMYGISNEITLRKAEESAIQGMQQEARKMEALGTLVGGIAHEFNNMLAGIIGNVFLLKSDIEAGSKSAVRLGRIEKLGNRAAVLVDQLLAFGRKNRIAVRDVNLQPLLEQTLAIESAGLPSGVTLKLDHESLSREGQVAVRADPSQLRQVLSSLISNASDACSGLSKGEISIGMTDAVHDATLASRFPRLAGKHVCCLRVRDNGMGIRKELLGRVFDPFFTTKEVGQGTGMGLSMVYGLMESFGGAIQIDSELGKGTSVYLYLQRGEPQAEAPSVSGMASVPTYGQGQTVLVADDEALLREAAFEMLQRLRYKPVIVEDGDAAVEYIREHGDEVSIILLDLIMPNMGGAEAAKLIREIRPELPIIFVTGYNLSEADNLKLQMPCSHIVAKPYPIADLSRIMAALLQAKA